MSSPSTLQVDASEEERAGQSLLIVEMNTCVLQLWTSARSTLRRCERMPFWGARVFICHERSSLRARNLVSLRGTQCEECPTFRLHAGNHYLQSSSLSLLVAEQVPLWLGVSFESIANVDLAPCLQSSM